MARSNLSFPLLLYLLFRSQAHKEMPKKVGKKARRLTLSVILVLCFLILFFSLSPACRHFFIYFFCQIDCELTALLLEMLCFSTLTPAHWLKPSQVSFKPARVNLPLHSPTQQHSKSSTREKFFFPQ